MKIKINAEFRASRHLRFEDTKRIVTRNAPEKLRETGSCTYQAQRTKQQIVCQPTLDASRMVSRDATRAWSTPMADPTTWI